MTKSEARAIWQRSHVAIRALNGVDLMRAGIPADMVEKIAPILKVALDEVQEIALMAGEELGTSGKGKG